MDGTTGGQETARFVTSRDGTRVGYLQQGSGPGVVLVQGAMADAHSYRELAEALSPVLTTYSLDRRGRGLSPRPYDSRHNITRDVEDIDAVLAATGAHFVFGLSSGAVITLEAARTLERVTRAAVYEPPFYAEGISHSGIQRLNADIEQGNLGAALIGALITAGTAPAPIRALPRPVARLLGRIVLSVDARGRGPQSRLRDLLPGVRYDFNAVGGMDGKIQSLQAIDIPVLLINGTTSPNFLQQATETLQTILPNTHRVVLDGLGHDGPWNRSRGGHPTVVANALREFFTH